MPTITDDSLMTVLSAWADESGKFNDPRLDSTSMAAVIGNQLQWACFRRFWQEMCDSENIPYLHIKELKKGIATGKGPFAKYKDPVELDRLMAAATDCIIHAGLNCRALGVMSADLESVIDKHNLSCRKESFCVYLLVVFLGTWALNSQNYRQKFDPSFHLFLDRVKGGASFVAEAEKLYFEDTFMRWRGWPLVSPLGVKSDSRKILELQAADLVAWSVRNEFKELGPWMRDIKPTLPPKNYKIWTDSHYKYVQNKLDQQEAAFPARRAFYRPWARLRDSRRLVDYIFDLERLEAHIIHGRKTKPDPRVMSLTLKLTGSNPLTP